MPASQGIVPIGSAPSVCYHVRSAFISDVHLGTRGCRADLLLDFLRAVRMDQLVLVGDIIDLWSLRRSFYWPSAHNDVMRAILAKAREGTRVIYVPGNHDHEFREFAGATLGQLEIRRDLIHDAADGRRWLVLHGDEFDGVVQCSPWLAAIGSRAYDWTLELNRHFNGIRRWFGCSYWSLAGYLKHRVGNAMRYIRSFEQAVTHEARRRGVDGVICGHIHRAAVHEQDGLTYCNDGDWVESCSALVEDRSGSMTLWNWAEMRTECAPQARAEVVGEAA
ncbi:MAG: UDP-2,3-diacylglucosamine diphosphatase [Steroidobacteraceae bacterium]